MEEIQWTMTEERIEILQKIFNCEELSDREFDIFCEMDDELTDLAYRLSQRKRAVASERTWLREYRGKLSEEKVASLLGISLTHYYNIESGRRNPSEKLAKKIAAFFGFDWKRFFEEEQPEETNHDKSRSRSRSLTLDAS